MQSELMLKGLLQRALLLAVLSTTACTSGTEVLAIDLREGDCSAADLSEISVISVEIYGANDQGRMCTMSKRCVFDVDAQQAPTSVEDISDALANANQPLIDVERDGPIWLAVVGRRRSDGCWSGEDEQHPACGFEDLAEVRDGVIEMTLNCEECPVDRAYDFCP